MKIGQKLWICLLWSLMGPVSFYRQQSLEYILKYIFHFFIRYIDLSITHTYLTTETAFFDQKIDLERMGK